jgi:hypothetical protein
MYRTMQMVLFTQLAETVKRMNMKLPIIIITTIILVGCIAIKPTDRIAFEAPDAYPEGIAYDDATQTYFVSSARTGAIGKVSRVGAYTVLHADSGLKSTYGVKIHPDGKRLFVCAGDANYSKFTAPDTRNKMARLISIDLASGKKLMDADLSGLLPGKHFPNDMAFDAEGNCYVTDSYAHAIYKVTDAGKASVWAKDKKFVTEGIGLNGIVYHPAGFILVDNSNTGSFYKIDIKNPSIVNKVAINQYFLGADGLLLIDSTHLAVVVNGGNDKIYKLTSKDNWNSAEMAGTTLIADRFTYPSTATKSDNEVWVMNAKFNELVDSNGVPSKSFAIQRAVFKPIPEKLRK